MSNALINGLSVVEARLLVPRLGNWTAELMVDATTAAQVPTGAQATLGLADGQLSYLGTVYRADVYADTVFLRLVGGSNGLASHCTPRFYAGPTVASPVSDALNDAGEQLSETSDNSALSQGLNFWSMVQHPAALELSSLAIAAGPGAIWRVLPDGTVFFGNDSYEAAALTDYELIEYVPQEGFQVIAAEVPDVYPGQTFAGHNVSVVEHIVTAAGSRAKVWFE